VLGPGDDGPLAGLGVEATSEDLAEFLSTGDSTRHLHTLLRDQHVVAGIGRGWADDILNRAALSPFASLRSLDADQRARLIESVRTVLDEALELERGRSGGLSEAKLGGRFAVHNRSGQPCPRCGTTLERVSFDSYEVVYCPTCQTKGKVLADRRMSRLLR
jgi:formamidopyrimidine-DNA glycosylase